VNYVVCNERGAWVAEAPDTKLGERQMKTNCKYTSW